MSDEWADIIAILDAGDWSKVTAADWEAFHKAIYGDETENT